jgi:type I restriction enzyme S subunit
VRRARTALAVDNAKAAWPLVPFGEVLERREPRVPVDPTHTYQFAGVYCFGRGVFRGQARQGAEFSYRTLTQLRTGDFVYPKLMAWEGAFGVVPDECDGCFVSPEFPVFGVREERLLGRFLGYYFQVPAVWQAVAGGSIGTNVRRRRLHPDDFVARSIPLPPLPEQQRIVATLDRLFATTSEAVGLRTRASKEAEAVVPAYLNRLIGTPSSGPLREWCSLNELVDDVADGPHVTPAYVDSGVPFITVLNITTGRIQFGNHSCITEQDHRLYQRRARAERGDVLLTKDGTIGLPCFVDTDREFSFFVSVALIKPRRGRLLGEFLTWVLRAPALQDHMRAHSRGDMIRHLVLREIRALPIPVLDLEEQRQIVDHLDGLNARISDLRHLQSQSAAEIQALTPTLLDRAFRGEL